MKAAVLRLAALLLVTSSFGGAQNPTDSIVLSRALEAVIAHRADIRAQSVSVGVDGPRAERASRQATLQAIARTPGKNRIIYRQDFEAARNCGVSCRSPFPEPLIVVSLVSGSGADRVVVMSLLLPDVASGGVEQAVLARGVRPGRRGSLFVVSLRDGPRGWEVTEVREGTGDAVR